jgi:hypothetical protein
VDAEGAEWRYAWRSSGRGPIALRQTLLAATGFTNKHLRVLMTGCSAARYTPAR